MMLRIILLLVFSKNYLIFMYNKISITLSILILLIIGGGVYWFKKGDACLAQPPFYNCRTQDKFAEIDKRLIEISDWSLRLEQKKPNILNIDDNYGRFTFAHVIDGQQPVLTKIIKDGVTKNALGFYDDYIDPVFYLDPEITSLATDRLIASIWFQPRDTKLYNGPFTNYFLDFSNREIKKLDIMGKLLAKSADGRKVVFLENECVKNPASLEIDHGCNNQNLSLRLIDLTSQNDGHFITHFEEAKLLDFNHVTFSPDGGRLAIEAKIESIDYDTPHEYWTLFIADTKTGEIIKQNNHLAKNRYEYVFWLDNESLIYW